jgi:hypothetical protein
LTNIVSVTLYGGLGNQLFQYAAARAISLRCNASLILDLSWFDSLLLSPDVTARTYALDPFKLPVKLKNSESNPRVIFGITNRIIEKVKNKFNFFFKAKLYFEKKFEFDENVLLLNAPIKLSGYWQSYKYFEPIEKIIRSEIGTIRDLSTQSREILKKINETDSICIHVRRGDYVSNKFAAQFHGNCSLEYYQRGTELAVEGLNSPHGYVFSDDPEWVRENLKLNIDFTVVDINGPKDAHQDLWLMSACKNFVIANSSLSWWAAWLGSWDNKKVIVPSNWFVDNSINTSDLFPPEWLKI